jgi:CheY-like chemotaxis protein
LDTAGDRRLLVGTRIIDQFRERISWLKLTNSTSLWRIYKTWALRSKWWKGQRDFYDGAGFSCLPIWIPRLIKTVRQFACSMMISRCWRRRAGYSPPRGWQAKSFSDPIAFLHHAQAYSPLVAVIDMSMPRMNGLEVQRRLCELSPATRVIFLTGKDDPAVRSQVLAAGASAFFLNANRMKNFLPESKRQSLRAEFS